MILVLVTFKIQLQEMRPEGKPTDLQAQLLLAMVCMGGLFQMEMSAV